MTLFQDSVTQGPFNVIRNVERVIPENYSGKNIFDNIIFDSNSLMKTVRLIFYFFSINIKAGCSTKDSLLIDSS